MYAAGEYSPAEWNTKEARLGSTPWLTTSSSYATNWMAGNSLATLPISGWGAWVRVVCWVGSVGVAGHPWPVGWCTSPAGLRRDCCRLQHLSAPRLRPLQQQLLRPLGGHEAGREGREWGVGR